MISWVTPIDRKGQVGPVRYATRRMTAISAELPPKADGAGCCFAICDQSGSAGAKLHFCLLCQLQGVLYLDAKVANRAFELRVAQQ
jgi:hypothetical protein